LGRALATDPELLLLDEPMAGMTIEEKQDMVRFIVDANEALGMTILLIEHGMGVVMDVAHRLCVLDALTIRVWRMRRGSPAVYEEITGGSRTNTPAGLTGREPFRIMAPVG
jgi:energy-coupling factor transporter ATP-binding protein EcfA2